MSNEGGRERVREIGIKRERGKERKERDKGKRWIDRNSERR